MEDLNESNRESISSDRNIRESIPRVSKDSRISIDESIPIAINDRLSINGSINMIERATEETIDKAKEEQTIEKVVEKLQSIAFESVIENIIDIVIANDENKSKMGEEIVTEDKKVTENTRTDEEIVTQDIITSKKDIISESKVELLEEDLNNTTSNILENNVNVIDKTSILEENNVNIIEGIENQVIITSEETSTTYLDKNIIVRMEETIKNESEAIIIKEEEIKIDLNKIQHEKIDLLKDNATSSIASESDAKVEIIEQAIAQQDSNNKTSEIINDELKEGVEIKDVVKPQSNTIGELKIENRGSASSSIDIIVEIIEEEEGGQEVNTKEKTIKQENVIKKSIDNPQVSSTSASRSPSLSVKPKFSIDRLPNRNSVIRPPSVEEISESAYQNYSRQLRAVKNPGRLTVNFGKRSSNALIKGEGGGDYEELKKKIEFLELEAKQQKKRYAIFKELLNTEIDYVLDLNVMINVYGGELLKSQLVSEDILRSIFSNCDMLLPVNLQLLSNIQKAIIFPDDCDLLIVADAFIKIQPYFRMYSMYCNNFESAIERLKSLCLNNKKVFKLLNKIASNNAEVRSLDLGSFLIKPVQRIYKYPLLLRDLLASIPDDNVNKAKIQKAYNCLSDIATEVNSRIKQNKNLSKVIEIHNEIGNEIEDLVQPNRRFILEQENISFSNKNKDFKTLSSKRHYKLYLFSDIIILAKSTLFSKSYKAKYMFDLLDCRIDEENSLIGDEKSESFAIIHLDFERTATKYNVLCQSDADKKALIDSLKIAKVAAENLMLDKMKRIEVTELIEEVQIELSVFKHRKSIIELETEVDVDAQIDAKVKKASLVEEKEKNKSMYNNEKINPIILESPKTPGASDDSPLTSSPTTDNFTENNLNFKPNKSKKSKFSTMSMFDFMKRKTSVEENKLVVNDGRTSPLSPKNEEGLEERKASPSKNLFNIFKK